MKFKNQIFIDETDKKILKVLESNSRASLREISKKTGLSVTKVYHHFNKLKREIIERFTIKLKREKLGLKFKAFILIKTDYEVLKKKKISQLDIANKLKKFEFIKNVEIIVGDYDLLCSVVCKDVEEFNNILFNIVHKIDGIESTHTIVSIRTIKE